MDTYTRKDLKNILTLVLISLVLGIYLIATTVVISKDGVTYIERSQTVLSDFNQLVKAKAPIGFDMLIVGVHSGYSLFFKTQSLQSWILSAQICVLTCKILAMVSLYFFGRCFFNRKHVFISLLVLSFLPHPTQFGVDVIRDWPHILFLFTAMLFLTKGIRCSSAGYMAAAGIVCALGQIIRMECMQVMIYGLFMFVILFGSTVFKKKKLPKKHIWLFLLAGYLLVFIPYCHKREKIFPAKRIKTFLTDNHNPNSDERVCAGDPVDETLLNATVNLAQTIMENFHYYFILPVGIGLYLRMCRKPKIMWKKNLLIGLFIGFNGVILLLLHLNHGYISRRHALPLCVMLSFHIPSGTYAIALYLTAKVKETHPNLKKWASAFIVIGIVICLPKTVSPIGKGKEVYGEAAKWIETHTAPDDRFVTFDPRIPFYGNRSNWKLYNEKKRPEMEPDYLICVTKNGIPSIDLPAQYVLAESFQHPNKEKGIQIFRRTQ